MYRVKEIFYTLQGEGAHTGRPAVFCRFSGCNLWSGREEDRSAAICQFCDTDFVGNEKFEDSWSLAQRIANQWPRGLLVSHKRPFVVLTGGEPLLQVDSKLCDDLHYWNFEIAVETNGTIGLPYGLDWICVSPKAGTKLVVTKGDELKLVYPQNGSGPELYEHLRFNRFSLQPMDGPDKDANTKAVLEYCLAHPQWSLSLQTHKILGLR